MFKNYFKVALRHLKRNTAYALINVLGLGAGITCTILIFVFVTYHLSFDTFHPSSDRVYRITTELHHENIHYTTGVPSPLIETFRDDYTFAEQVAGVANLPGRLVTLPSADKYEENIAFAQPAFFDIMNFPLLQGDTKTLQSPNTAVVTERIAWKYFGSDNALGKAMRIDNQIDVVITGVLKDLPDNTDRREEIYLSFENLKDHSPWMVEKDWWLAVNKRLQCFVRLKPGVTTATVQDALREVASKHYETPKEWQFQLQPLSDIHFNANLGGHTSRKNLWALALIGVFLIVTACVNFINLATAQALGRSKEIGVRKVLGGYRWQLFWQFMTETAVIAGTAVTLAYMAAYTVLPYVNTRFGVSLALDLFADGQLVMFLLTLLVVVALFSGFYPGLIIAGFKPVQALKGKVSQRDEGRFSIRKGLVVTQFAISQLLIIGTLVVANQMRYAAQADMGFTKDAVVMLPLPVNQVAKRNALLAQLEQVPGVDKVTFCNSAPASDFIPNTGIRFDTRTENEKFLISFKAGDHAYTSTFGLQLVEGRDLYPSDTAREFLINETAVRNLGVASNAEVIGRSAEMNGQRATIVGVVKDFHNKSLHEAIDPIYITNKAEDYIFCAVKINVANLRPVLQATQNAWKNTFPDHVYTYDFLDEKIARFYEQDNIFLSLIQVFAGISVLIGCLGLYGLVSFMASRKIKEVGVRKVFGASMQNILWIFGREFMQLLLVAFAVAAPLAWLMMNHWLENFTYRVDIGAGIFVLAIVITIGIAVLTVGYRALNAALANPVKSLRDE